MHHGNHGKSFPLDPRVQDVFGEVNPKLGATGKYPDGKLNENDEGEILCAIGEKKGKVIMDFGKKPISWIGLSKDQALQIANSLILHASKIKEEK